MADQSYEIEVERDGVGTARRVWLTVASDGALGLSGHDLGAGVSDFWGEGFDEYEWSWTLHPGRAPALFDSLQVAPESTEAALELALSLRAIGTLAAQKQFENAGAEFWSHLGG